MTPTFAVGGRRMPVGLDDSYTSETFERGSPHPQGLAVDGYPDSKIESGRPDPWQGLAPPDRSEDDRSFQEFYQRNLSGSEEKAQPIAFIGPNSQHPLSEKAFGLARQMRAKGASREEIWRATGQLGLPVFTDKHGKEWAETLSKPRMRGALPSQPTPMEQVWDDPEFYQAYPNARKLPITADKFSHRSGDYIPPGRSQPEGIYTRDNDDPSVVGHEAQHFIQRQEGRRPDHLTPYLATERMNMSPHEKLRTPPWDTEAGENFPELGPNYELQGFKPWPFQTRR